MVIKAIIMGLLLAGCPSKTDRRKTGPTATPSPSETPKDDDRGNGDQQGATHDTGRGGGGGRSTTVVGGGTTATDGGNGVADGAGLDPNDYVKEEGKTDGSDPSQSPPEETDGGNPSQSSSGKTADSDPSQSSSGKTASSDPKQSPPEKDSQSPVKTVEQDQQTRQQSPMASLSFVEQEGHLWPVLELTDATAVSDLEIYRQALDLAIDSDNFKATVTAIPRHQYFIKLKVQERQCNNEVEIKELTETETFRMNCP